MLIVKCSKCGDSVRVANFQKGDTVNCPECGNANIVSSYKWDTQVGASRSYLRGILWTLGLLFYMTIIIYVVAGGHIVIYNPQLTWLIAIFWVICPVCAYFSIKEKQEKREREQEEIERKKDFDREMTGRNPRL
jgi:DNA-directed RNA polymerase subunit RPC12/RpoP